MPEVRQSSFALLGDLTKVRISKACIKNLISQNPIVCDDES